MLEDTKEICASVYAITSGQLKVAITGTWTTTGNE